MSQTQNLDTGESYVAMNLFQPPTAHADVFGQALEQAVAKISDLIPVFGQRNPRIGEAGTYRYQFCLADEWVASFWSGQLWLAYSLTGEERFKNSARMRREYFQTVLERPDWHDHDLGFLFSLSCVADWKLTGNERARSMALRAADFLAARRRHPMRFVMCWNPMRRDPPDFAAAKTGTLNIDSMQAMALLFWAHEQTGQNSFVEIAQMHLETSAKYLIREDHSSFHAFEFDPRTGDPIRGFTHQGLNDDSCWSRGQSWAIHGFAQSYLYTGNLDYRDMAAKLADYISDKLPDDGVPLWDYNLPADMHPWRDSSAGAVTAAGLYALAQGFGQGPQMERYAALADRILLGLVQRCAIADRPEAHGLLKEGAAFVALDRADSMLPYGDYYYLEALMRAVGHTEFLW